MKSVIKSHMPSILRANDSAMSDRDRDARMYSNSSTDFMYPLSRGRSRKADVICGEIKLAAIKSRRSARPDERGVRDISAAAINNFFTILMRTHHRSRNEFIINGRRVYSTLTNCTWSRDSVFTVMPILRETGGLRRGTNLITNARNSYFNRRVKLDQIT